MERVTKIDKHRVKTTTLLKRKKIVVVEDTEVTLKVKSKRPRVADFRGASRASTAGERSKFEDANDQDEEGVNTYNADDEMEEIVIPISMDAASISQEIEGQKPEGEPAQVIMPAPQGSVEDEEQL